MDTPKVTVIFFSTNRLQYLLPTLDSFDRQVDFTNTTTYKILCDDYPKDRDPKIFEMIQQRYSIDELILHQKNKGQSETWKELWSKIPKDTDYVFQMEDDFTFNTSIKITDLIDILKADPYAIQIALKRNVWYPKNDFIDKINSGVVGNEVVLNGTPVIKHQTYFNANPNMCPVWVTQETYPHNPQESVIIHHLVQKDPKYYSAILGKRDDPPHVTHIGEVMQGKKVAPGEPGWDWLKEYDPDKKYFSKEYLKEVNFS
uniref:Glycosyltransferase 2-like domain-containing protein n=1 Tax=viral metagenome TaxID=1070528 RepID=A0A6C0CJ30_9ZZZZ